MDLQNSSSFPENWRTRTSKQTKSEHSFACGWKFEEPKREDDPVAEQNSSRVFKNRADNECNNVDNSAAD